MVKGDKRNGLASVTAGGFLDIRPPVGEEWTIQYIFHEFEVRLYWTDGTLKIMFDSEISGGYWAKHNIGVTYDIWVTVENPTSSPYLVGYGAVLTHTS